MGRSGGTVLASSLNVSCPPPPPTRRASPRRHECAARPPCQGAPHRCSASVLQRTVARQIQTHKSFAARSSARRRVAGSESKVTLRAAKVGRLEGVGCQQPSMILTSSRGISGVHGGLRGRYSVSPALCLWRQAAPPAPPKKNHSLAHQSGTVSRANIEALPLPLTVHPQDPVAT